MVQLSAEVRWFWKEALPPQLENWFHSYSAFRPGGGPPPRQDEYLIEYGQTEIGFKKRGNKAGAEVKGLVATLPPPVQLGLQPQAIQIWAKWTTNANLLDGRPTLAVNKSRWLRKYNTREVSIREIELDSRELPKNELLPEEGCNVELTTVSVRDTAEWWTLGLEAFGRLQSVESSLRRTLTHLITSKLPPITGGVSLSYPE